MSGPRPVILVLAGGLATRMGGGDKALRPFGGSTLLDYVLDRVAGQGDPILLNANGDPARFARFGLPVVPDTVPGHPGPLAGVLAGMEWVRANTDAIDLVTVPSDTPLIPTDLAARLMQARDAAGAELACACSSGRMHPVAALWPVRLADDLRRALVEEKLHRVSQWAARYRLSQADFPDSSFFNVNTPDDLVIGEALSG